MSKSWLRMTVELQSGLGQAFVPKPGRILIVSPTHNFAELARAINIAFARWDHSHLFQFSLPTGEVIGAGDEDAPSDELVAAEVAVGSLLRSGMEFSYVFDFGDEWTHSCRVEMEEADPIEEYGEIPAKPVPIWGWGTIPDQYGRNEPEINNQL